jgi:hypothetical protein
MQLIRITPSQGERAYGFLALGFEEIQHEKGSYAHLTVVLNLRAIGQNDFCDLILTIRRVSRSSTHGLPVCFATLMESARSRSLLQVRTRFMFAH